MREILFRGKRLDNGEWVESHGISRGRPDEKSGYKYYLGIGGGAIVGTNEAGNIVRLEAREDCLYCEVDPATVGQCTGLKDKNGKWIFEGDLCQMKIGSFAPEASLMRIVIRNACVGFEPVHPEKMCEEDKDWKPFYESNDGTMWNIDYFEVVGNIHDNPELLEAAT